MEEEVEVEVEVEAEVEVEVIRLTKGTTRFWRCGAGSGSAVPAVIALLACCCFCCSHADQRVGGAHGPLLDLGLVKLCGPRVILRRFGDVYDVL